MQNNHAIVMQDLSKTFGKVQAVDRLNLTIEQGEVFGMLGPNGAGKTTTVRMLSALIEPTGGTATVAGYSVREQAQQVRSRVGILTESPGLYDQLSAERNLSFFAQMYDVVDIPAKVEQYLRLLGLWDRRHEAVGGFSKGMRQKLAIARALLHEPEILFLDEPTAGLDPAASRLIREFIQELREDGRTIVLCTHNLDEADRLCDRIAVLRGHLLALDTPTALRRKLYGRSVVFHLRETAPAYVDLLKGVDFVHEVQSVENKLVVRLDEPEAQNPLLIRKLVQAGADIQFVGEVRQRLEDVYLQLVNTESGR
jgi:ABC-2 type transport system ATP-binding protein